MDIKANRTGCCEYNGAYFAPVFTIFSIAKQLHKIVDFH